MSPLSITVTEMQNVKAVTPTRLRFAQSLRVGRFWWVVPFLLHDIILLIGTMLPATATKAHVAYQAQANFWFQFDALYFVNIGKHGYLLPGNDLSQTAFFPFVPVLVHLLGKWAVLILQQATFALSLVFLKRFFSTLGMKENHSIWAVWFFALNPCAIFYTTLYAEPWCMLLALLSLNFANKSRWFVAAIFGGLASATQGTGILVGLFPLVLFVESIYRKDWKSVRNSLIWGIGCSFGLLFYSVYLWKKFSNPLEFSSVQIKYWHANWDLPWNQLVEAVRWAAAGHISYTAELLIPFTILMFGVFGLFFRQNIKKPSSEGLRNLVASARIYAIVGLIVSLSFRPTWYPLHSAVRFLSDYFPIYGGLSVGIPRKLKWLVVVLFIVTGIIGANLFSHTGSFQ